MDATLPMKARELAAALARADDARLMSLEARVASVEASMRAAPEMAENMSILSNFDGVFFYILSLSSTPI